MRELTRKQLDVMDMMWGAYGENALCVLSGGIIFETINHVYEVFWMEHAQTIVIIIDPGTGAEEKKIMLENEEWDSPVDIFLRIAIFIK